MSLCCSALYAKCPYYVVLYMQSVLNTQCFICKPSFWFSVLYAKCSYYLKMNRWKWTALYPTHWHCPACPYPRCSWPGTAAVYARVRLGETCVLEISCHYPSKYIAADNLASTQQAQGYPETHSTRVLIILPLVDSTVGDSLLQYALPTQIP